MAEQLKQHLPHLPRVEELFPVPELKVIPAANVTTKSGPVEPKKKRRGYTKVPNSILTDTVLSAKAKMVYGLIRFCNSIPNVPFTQQTLRKYMTEGKDVLDAAWNELRKKGYLKVHIYNIGKGTRTEYVLLEEATLGDSIFYHNREGIITSSKR